MKDPIPTRLGRIARWARHGLLTELLASGILVFLAGWPIILLRTAMTHFPR